jgi:hypothetical protein
MRLFQLAGLLSGLQDDKRKVNLDATIIKADGSTVE